MTQRVAIAVLLLATLCLNACSAEQLSAVDGGFDANTTTTMAAPTMTEDSVDVDGLSVDNTTINIGVLADLTGPYSTGVVDVLDAQLAFWADLNDRGGIDGRTVEVLIEDTGYDTTRHLRAYHRLVDRVVMFSHSTGTPQTAAISDLLVADERVAIPLTWYSGWSSEPTGSNLVELGSNYCIEAVNTLAYLADQADQPLRIAVATVPGDFGSESAAGLARAASSLDIEIVFDAAGALDPEADLGEIGRAIALADPDWVWLSADPSLALELVAAASQFGYEGGWTGSSPTWNTRLLATQLGPMLSESVVVPSLVAPLGADVDGMDAVYRVLAERLPDRYPSEALVVGYLEFEATRRLLEAAATAGDLTPAGVARLADSIVGSGFGGISPAAEAGPIVTATGISRLSYDTFALQEGLGATLASDAVTPIMPVAPFEQYALAAALDYGDVCP